MIPAPIKQRRSSNTLRIQKIWATCVSLLTCRSRYALYSMIVLCLTIVLLFRGVTICQVSFAGWKSDFLRNYFQNTYKFTTRKTSNRIEIPDNPRFQQITGHDAWVFSAFFDRLDNKTLIRIFGIQDLKLKNPVHCFLTENNVTSTVVGHRTLLMDFHGNRCRIVSYECEIGAASRPVTVSVSFNESVKPSNSLKVLYPLPTKQRNFTVCYATLFNYTNYRQFVQNLEFNRVLGAEYFFVYNMSISPETDVVLQHYQQQGLLTVIQWPVPTAEVHYNGQVLAINDCVYRNKGASKYVVIQDTDEFIIPNRHGNWSELIDQVDKDCKDALSKSSKRFGSLGTYTVESTFFTDRPNASEWVEIKRKTGVTDEDEQLLDKYSLTVFTNLQRLNSTFKDARQKSIVRPELILFAEVHATMKHRGSASTAKVNISMALVHHQRNWDYVTAKVTETTSLRFKDKVLPLVNQTFKQLPV